MDFDEYRVKGKEVVDYIADYLENIRERRVFPDVTPGYIRDLLPKEAPAHGESWDEIFKDVERVIMPGITHWQSPHMHAYFPALNSFPSLLGDMISEAINCLSFTWAASPAATELESLVMDWLVKCLGLPEKFLSSSQEPFGGGVLQTSVSEATYFALLAARTKMFHKYGVGDIDKYAEKSEINGRLVCYCSEQAHSSVEKAALVAITRIRLLPSDEKLSLRGNVLRQAIEQDKRNGLIPFFVCATLGTTGACAFDNLEEIGQICNEEGLWLHIDAAYAGSALFCEENRKFSKGVENATSFVFNPSKWLLVNFDCTCFWVESSIPLHQTFTVAPLYLKHKYSGAAVDYMHWQIALSRRFRSLKLWFVLRSYGIEGIKAHIRKGVELARKFEELVKSDDRFETIAERHLGLVVFRLKGNNEVTEHLLKQLNKDGRIHVVPACIKDKYIIRFTVTSYYTTEEDIERDWHIIKSNAEVILKQIENERVIKETEEMFQPSLILCNAPQTPKIVNASFMAFSQDLDLAYEFAKELTHRSYEQSHLPLIPRKKTRIMSSQKGYSVDYLNIHSSSLIENGIDESNEAASCMLEDHEANHEFDKESLVKSSTGNVLTDLFKLRSLKLNGDSVKQTSSAPLNGSKKENRSKSKLNNILTINCDEVNEKCELEEKNNVSKLPFYTNLDFIKNSALGKYVFNKQASLDSKIQGFYENECSQDANKQTNTSSSNDSKPK